MSSINLESCIYTALTLTTLFKRVCPCVCASVCLCLRVCVCLCVWVCHACVWVWVSVYVFPCIHTHDPHTHTHTHTHIHTLLSNPRAHTHTHTHTHARAHTRVNIKKENGFGISFNKLLGRPGEVLGGDRSLCLRQIDGRSARSRLPPRWSNASRQETRWIVATKDTKGGGVLWTLTHAVINFCTCRMLSFTTSGCKSYTQTIFGKY